MIPNMNFKRYTRIFYVLLMLLMYGVGEAWAVLAAGDIYIKVKPSETEATTSVTATEGTVTAAVSGQVVTLTVTPANGYYIKASDIVVEPLAGMGRANSRRRAPGLAEKIEGTLYNHATNREPENVIYSVTASNTGCQSVPACGQVNCTALCSCHSAGSS